MGIKNLFKKHPHWGAVEFCLKTLADKGFVAYLAGGCVRDALLGIAANDFDIATDATPDQVEALFEKSIAVGKQFGVIVIPFKECQVEIATFRMDAEYKDGRHPESVSFSSPEEDAKRRDFTVNGMFYDHANDRVVDFVEGQADLQKKVLRVIGSPEQRFSEDQLRLMRAIRFRAQLDFEWDQSTKDEVIKRSRQISSVSIERVREEIFKTLKAKKSFGGLIELYEFKYLEAIFPDFLNYVESIEFDQTTFAHSLERALGFHHNDFLAFEELVGLVLISFCTSLSPNFESKKFETEVETLLERFKVSNQEKKFLLALKALVLKAQSHQDPTEDDEFIFWLAKGNRLSVFKFLSSLKFVERFDLQSLTRNIESIFSSHLEAPQALVTGDDLKSRGVSQGKEMGEVLKRIYIRQLREPGLSKNELIEKTLAE